VYTNSYLERSGTSQDRSYRYHQIQFNLVWQSSSWLL